MNTTEESHTIGLLSIHIDKYKRFKKICDQNGDKASKYNKSGHICSMGLKRIFIKNWKNMGLCLYMIPVCPIGVNRAKCWLQVSKCFFTLVASITFFVYPSHNFFCICTKETVSEQCDFSTEWEKFNSDKQVKLLKRLVILTDSMWPKIC